MKSFFECAHILINDLQVTDYLEGRFYRRVCIGSFLATLLQLMGHIAPHHGTNKSSCFSSILYRTDVLCHKSEFISKRIWTFYNVKIFIYDFRYKKKNFRSSFNLQKDQMLNYGLDIQSLKFFHECNLYDYLIFTCKTSKQLEHQKIEML